MHEHSIAIDSNDIVHLDVRRRKLTLGRLAGYDVMEMKSYDLGDTDTSLEAYKQINSGVAKGVLDKKKVTII